MPKQRRASYIHSSGVLHCSGDTPEDCYRQMEDFLDRMPGLRCKSRVVWMVKEENGARYVGDMQWERKIAKAS